MNQGIQNLRQTYKNYRKRAYDNDFKSVSTKEIVRNRKEAERMMGSMQAEGRFEHLEEVDFYKDKFKELEESHERARREKMKWNQFNPIIQDILSQKQYVPRNSYLKKKPRDPQTSQAPPVQSKVLNSFFQEKKSKLVPEVGFKSLLESPPVTTKSFRKKAQNNYEQIQRLKMENTELKRRLEEGETSGHERQIVRQQQQRIRWLEDQNQLLSRDNDKLRSEKSVTYVQSRISNDDYVYSPYSFIPRDNDLYKINVRNEIDLGNSNFRQHQFEDDKLPSFNGKTPYKVEEYDNRSEDNHNQNYSVFDMSKSYYSDSGVNDSKLGIESSKMVSKNKIAFFKSAGILTRQEDFEVAYKRAEPNEKDDFSSIRIILYFNNKKRSKRNISVSYDYERNYYDIDTTEKVKSIDSLKQAREVIEITLSSQASDLNSVIEANVRIDSEEYKIWIPAMFIKISEYKHQAYFKNLSSKTIHPHKYFGNPEEAEKILPGHKNGQGDFKVWGQSKFQEGPIELHWRKSGKLTVSSPEKWIDFISFVMFDYH